MFAFSLLLHSHTRIYVRLFRLPSFARFLAYHRRVDVYSRRTLHRKAGKSKRKVRLVTTSCSSVHLFTPRCGRVSLALFRTLLLYTLRVTPRSAVPVVLAILTFGTCFAFYLFCRVSHAHGFTLPQRCVCVRCIRASASAGLFAFGVPVAYGHHDADPAFARNWSVAARVYASFRALCAHTLVCLCLPHKRSHAGVSSPLFGSRFARRVCCTDFGSVVTRFYLRCYAHRFFHTFGRCPRSLVWVAVCCALYACCLPVYVCTTHTTHHTPTVRVRVRCYTLHSGLPHFVYVAVYLVTFTRICAFTFAHARFYSRTPVYVHRSFWFGFTRINSFRTYTRGCYCVGCWCRSLRYVSLRLRSRCHVGCVHSHCAYRS